MRPKLIASERIDRAMLAAERRIGRARRERTVTTIKKTPKASNLNFKKNPALDGPHTALDGPHTALDGPHTALDGPHCCMKGST